MPGRKAKAFDQPVSAGSMNCGEFARTSPPHRPSNHSAKGFTLVELLVVMAILAILLSLIMAAISRARANASAVACCANLRQIGVAFHVYAGDNAGRLPDPSDSGISWETAIRFCSSNVLRCPADEEIYPAVGSSYDWRDTGNPDTTLSGRALTKARNDAVLAFETLPGWHSRKYMNAVRVDGSALIMEEKDCLADLQLSPMRAGIAQEGGNKP
jgi:prepilin-type N-terminal cleavage/methylation domain-containing protein